MRLFFVALALLCTVNVARADDSDADALSIADQAPNTTTRPSAWRSFLETGIEESQLGAGAVKDGERFSADVHYDETLWPGLRAIASDRLDSEHLDRPSTQSEVNTLKEAYLSWQVGSNEIVDFGRVNLRYGVAMGYNPTDFFRVNALRSIVSLDPSSLRENRQGSVVLQSQTLWEGSSVSALISPKLDGTGNTADFSPDFGATNPEDRWLLSASHQFANNFNPQLLLYGGEHIPPELGLNVSSLVNAASVAYLEWSGGRNPTLVAQAFGIPGPSTFHTRAALGFTYTTDFNLSLTAEYELNSAGVNAAALGSLSNGSRFGLAQYLEYIQTVQDLPTKRAMFFSGTWTDAMARHLDISAFARLDPAGHSHMQWCEARYHLDHSDVAVQLEYFSGTGRSIFGAVPEQRLVQVLWRYFL